MERRKKNLSETAALLWLSAALVLATIGCSGCSMTPEAREARFLATGKAYLAKNDYSRAVIEFQNAIRLKKTDAEPYYQLGLAYVGLKNYEMAYKALDRALEINPAHRLAKTKKAELMVSVGTREVMSQGATLARGVLAENPSNADALNSLAIAEWKLGEQRNAEMDLVRAANQAPQNLKVALNLAIVKFSNGDVAGAEMALKRLAAASPNAIAPVLVLGEFYGATGKLDLAEQQWRHALQLDPNNDSALLALAKLYVRTNRVSLADQTYKQISGLPGTKYKPLHAMFLFQTGKREQAVAEFEELARKDPSERSLRNQLIEAYIATNRLPDADKVLSAALQKNPKDTDALLHRSRIYLLTGNYQESQKAIERVLSFQPNSARAHYVMAEIYGSRGQVLERRQELTEALRLDARLLPVRIELAGLLIKTGSAGAALQILNAATDAEKAQPGVIVQRNWAMLALGNMVELRKGIDQGLATARLPELLLQDALWKLKSGQPQPARVALEEALKLSPTDIRLLSAMNQTYIAQKQAEAGLQKIKEYAGSQPKSAAVQEFFGGLLAAQGQLSQARAAFMAAKAADPHMEQVDLSLAQIDVAEGKWDAARARLDQLLAQSPRSATALLWLANIEEARGDHKNAINHLKQVLEASPENAQALNNLAYLLTESLHDLDEALKYAQRAVEIAPERRAFCDTLGWILYQKGLYPSAITYLQRAAEDPENVIWKYHLAMAYAKAGESRQSRMTLEAALKMNPNLPEAKIAREVIAKAR